MIDSTDRKFAINLKEKDRVAARQRGCLLWYERRMVHGALWAEALCMLRIVAIPLWFISVWFAYGLVAYFLGLPSDGGAVLGALLAALVALDPTGAFWGPRRRDVTRPTALTPSG